MMTNKMHRLKSSLHDAINYWAVINQGSEGWRELDTFVSDKVSELMTDAAFAVLLAQSDLTKYYKEQNMLTD